MTLKDFIDCLFDNNDIIELRYLPEKNTTGTSQAKSILLSKAQLLTKIANNEISKIVNSTNLYPCIGINPRNTNKRDVSLIKNLLLDYDNTKPPDIILENASIICKRKNSWHIYFCFLPLKFTEENKELYSKYAKKIAKSTAGDINATDVTRVVRLPTFPYRKNNVFENGYEILKINSERKSFQETFAFLGKLENLHDNYTVEKYKKSHNQIKNKNRISDETARKNIENYLLTFYFNKFDIIPKGEGRSKFLYFFGCDCHGWGLELERAIELAKLVNNEKCLPPEDEKVVIHQIKSAYKYRKAEFGNYLEAFGSVSSQNEAVKTAKHNELIYKIREKFHDWVYCHEAERFINTTNNFMLTSQSQCELYMTQKLSEKVSLRYALQHGALNTVEKIDYRPDKNKFFTENGIEYYNTYIPPAGYARDCDKEYAIEIFTDHLRYLTNDDREFAWLLSWFAFIVQNVGKKVMWAPLIISQHTGVGKSALVELLKILFGEWNVSEVSSYDLITQYTDYIANKMLVASHEVELAEKEAMHRLKNLITERKVRIIQKYARTYEATNCANFIFLSNKPDALKIDEEDRRLFVIYHRKQPREQEYYRNLFYVIYEGNGHIYDYLMSLDLRNFDPHRRPPVTQGKELVISNSMGDLAHYLAKLRDEKLSVFSQDYFQTYELFEYVQEYAPLSIQKYCTMRTLQLWLVKNNYSNYVINIKTDSGWIKKCYWSDKLSKEQLIKALKSKVI